MPHCPQFGYWDESKRMAVQLEVNPDWWFSCKCGCEMSGNRKGPWQCPECGEPVDLQRRPH